MTKPDYTLTDYVRWMGGFSFEEKPFCETDAMVLCDVVYFEIFDTETSPGKTLRELIAAAPVEDASIVKMVGGGSKRHIPFIRAVESSVRFGGLTIGKYSETLDLEQSVQFAAVTFKDRDRLNFIAFRGTDDTIAGWKEDFMIAFTNTAAQNLALKFAEETIKKDDAEIFYIGGHSKGGNLALYAAADLPEELQPRLTHVYDLDGPGFCSEVFDLDRLKAIRYKTTFIIPEFDVIGKLFSPDIPDIRIVKSSETAIMQHELLSWGVNRQGLDTVSENDPRARNINSIIDDWVENISQEDRKTFVNELFEALGADGAKTMTEIMEKGLDGFEKIFFQAAGSSTVTKRAIASLPEQAFFGNLIREFKEKGLWRFLQTNGTVRALLLIASGILFIFASENIINVVPMLLLTGLTGLQITLTVRRLRENHWKFESVRDRLHLCAIMVVLCICLYVKEQAAFLLGSVIFAITALLISVQTGLKINSAGRPFYRRLLNAGECAVCAIYGISFLVIPRQTVYAFSLSIGFGLIIDGVIRILFEIIDHLRKIRREKRKLKIEG